MSTETELLDYYRSLSTSERLQLARKLRVETGVTGSKSQAKRETRCYGYGRASTSYQVLSEDKQKDTILSAVKARGVSLHTWFCDSATSGKTPFCEREAASKLLDLVQEGDTIYAWKLDRIGRDFFDCLDVIRMLTETLKVNLVVLDFAGMQLDLESAIGKMFVVLMAGMAELQREYASQTSKEATELRRRRGLPINNRRIWGYKLIKHKLPPGSEHKHRHELKPDYKEREALRIAASYDSRQYTAQEICDYLNNAGLTYGSMDGKWNTNRLGVGRWWVRRWWREHEGRDPWEEEVQPPEPPKPAVIETLSPEPDATEQ